MGNRARKAVGVAACVIYLVIYCLIAMAVGANYVSDTPRLVQMGFYLLAGVLWLPPVMMLIRWMERAPR